MNQVGTVNCFFDMQSQAFVQELYGRWNNFFELSMGSVLEEALGTHNRSGQHIEIDLLEVNLGKIPQSLFDEQFQSLFRQKLDEALTSILSSPHHSAKLAKKVGNGEKQFLLLCQYLLQGTIPWYAEQQYGGLRALFLLVLQTNSSRLKKFLLNYGHYTSLQQRLALQLQDESIESTVRLLAPSESQFICSYARFVISRHKKRKNDPNLSQSDYRAAVWTVVLAYLLNNRSSYFNKKSFLNQTISQLAAKINSSYVDLLGSLAEELDRYTVEQLAAPGLFLMLAELKQALKSDDPSGTDKLLGILADSTLCRRYLAPLSEENIVRIVYLVIPHEANFVVAYAQTLNRQHQSGYLQGKTGTDFRRLKWHFILPLLVENRGLGFNRKHFVRQVIEQLAAHYNLQWRELLGYLYAEMTKRSCPMDLQEILSNLYQSEQVTLQVKDNHRQALDQLFKAIRSSSFVPSHAHEQALQRLAQLLGQPITCGQLLWPLSEAERHHLVAMLYPVEKGFIVAYAQALDSGYASAKLQGKAGGEFRLLKWEFIFATLMEERGGGINKRYLVRGVIAKIAAHYNLYVHELVAYFYKVVQHMAQQLPKQLIALLAQIYQEEKGSVPRRETEELIAIQKEGRLLLEAWLGTFSIAFRALWQKPFSASTALVQLWAFWSVRKDDLSNDLHFWKLIWQHTIKGLNETEILGLCAQLKVQSHGKPLRQLLSRTGLLDIPYKVGTDILPIAGDKIGQEAFCYVQNAGLVLLAPFLPRLFQRLLYLQEGKFAARDLQIRAMFLLQYMAFGKTSFPEHEMPLNKLLVGFRHELPLPTQLSLTQEEQDTADSLLQGVLQHWSKLQHTTPNGLRQSFLQREGKLERLVDADQLVVEEKAYDMLLDAVPWQFKMIKYSWMEKPLQVKWR